MNKPFDTDGKSVAFYVILFNLQFTKYYTFLSKIYINKILSKA